MDLWVALILNFSKTVEQNFADKSVFSSQQPKKILYEDHALQFFDWAPSISVVSGQGFHMATILFGILINHEEKELCCSFSF